MKRLLSTIAVMSFVVVFAACSGGGGGGENVNATSGNWVDNNHDGVYDPYQQQSLWNQMNSFVNASTGSWLLSPRVAYAAPQQSGRMRAWRGNGHMAPTWMDNNHDGIVDYAQNQNLWRQYHLGPWYDKNGDGICDNFPNSARWGEGWR